MDPKPETLEDVAVELDARTDAYLSRTTKRITVDVPVDTHAWLKGWAVLSGLSIADLVRGMLALVDGNPSFRLRTEQAACEVRRARHAAQDVPADEDDAFDLPDVGDLVRHGDANFRVTHAHHMKKRFPGPVGDRVMLTYNITAWVGDQPYEEPAPDRMF